MALGQKAFSPKLSNIFERGIDPEVMEPERCHTHSTLPCQWPTAPEVERYLKQCHKETLAGIIPLLDKEGKEGDKMTHWIRGGRVHQLSIEHELLHQETMMYMYMQLDVQYKQLPYDIKFDLKSRKLTEPLRVAIPTGSVQLGADFDTFPFGWDNEFPAFTASVPAFQIDRYPVTNGEFHEV